MTWGYPADATRQERDLVVHAASPGQRIAFQDQQTAYLLLDGGNGTI